jgi:hypothetical protein
MMISIPKRSEARSAFEVDPTPILDLDVESSMSR